MSVLEDLDVDHPKVVLYDDVYDPLTRDWFAALVGAPELQRLLDEIPLHNLVDNFTRFNELFHRLVDECLHRTSGRNEVLETVFRHRGHVLWADHKALDENSAYHLASDSLSEKMKRNISLGVVEALICLESALVVCRDDLHLRGPEIVGVVRRSRQLYGSLAVLHDEQEREKLTFLTGIEGHLRYPEVDYAAVLSHHVRVPFHRFVVSGAGNNLRLRFAGKPVQAVSLKSPVRRCPAHRLRSPENSEHSLNDVLWDLLIDIYTRAGRFDAVGEAEPIAGSGAAPVCEAGH